MFLVVIAIFVLSVAIGSAIGSALARLAISGLQRGMVAAHRPMPRHATADADR
jgi:hypothetical protein